MEFQKLGYKTYEGIYDGSDLRFAIIVPRFNSTVTERLLEGAIDCLLRHNVKEDNITVIRVPGSMEVIYVLNQLTKVKREELDGIIVLGAVIQGETYHFNVVANEIGKAVAQFNMTSDIPVTFGVLTTETVEQALNRAGIKSGNKGFEAAMAALEMANLKRKIVG